LITQLLPRLVLRARRSSSRFSSFGSRMLVVDEAGTAGTLV
jgi:hypothetical protein